MMRSDLKRKAGHFRPCLSFYLISKGKLFFDHFLTLGLLAFRQTVNDLPKIRIVHISFKPSCPWTEGARDHWLSGVTCGSPVKTILT